MIKPILTLITIIAFPRLLAAQQYTVNGNALQNSCRCYTLTPAAADKKGSVWNNYRIDLNTSFNFVFDVNLGCTDVNGADGIAFVLQPISTSVGSTGSGLGFSGIAPSIGVTLDTYQNSSPDNDPFYDHIGIQRNGDLNHISTNNLAGPIAISAVSNNVEDCLDHKLRVNWDAVTKTLSVYFDNVLRVSVINDLVNTTFSGNPLVYWGFTGSTGALSNEQKFCTALAPAWGFANTQKRCVNEPIQFFDSTISFTTLAKIYWDFGDGSGIDSVNTNPIHTYTGPGDYIVTQRVRGADGCEEINTQTVRIGGKPTAGFFISDSCVSAATQFTDTSRVTVGVINEWYWELDNGGITSTQQNPSTLYTTPGIKNIKLMVKSQEGCSSDTLFQPIRIRARPVADFTFTDSLCLGSAYTFTDQSTLVDGPVTGWVWGIDGTGLGQNVPVITHVFSTPGQHSVILFSTGLDASCLSQGITKNVFVTDKPVAAIKNPDICQAAPAILEDSSYTHDGFAITGWWWDLGNGQFSTQQNPAVTYNTTVPVIIRLVVRNSRGCLSDTLTRTINVHAKPLSGFGYSTPLCASGNINFTDLTTVAGGTPTQWSWIHNGAVFSNQQNPAGNYSAGTVVTVGLVATSNDGCVSDTAYKTFTMKTKPAVSMNFGDACKQAPVNFTAAETTATGISNWVWDLGDGTTATSASVTHTYTANGTYPIKLYAISGQGCYSDTLERALHIYGTNAFAGNDTIAASLQPVQLNAAGGLSYEWSPATGLSATDIPNPVATNASDREYYLKAFTPEGCESYDTIRIKIYIGPEIYVPGSFTPNGDGTNDLLRAIPVGITSFEYFVVYNRYGQEVFKTSDYRQGWDGRVKGKAQETGAFVWMATAIDFMGKKIFRKGAVLLLR